MRGLLQFINFAKTDLLIGIREYCLKRVAKDLGENSLADSLREIIPNITNQYSQTVIDNSYLELKLRGMHNFQVSLAQRAIKLIGSTGTFTIVDIGDSAGTHLSYISALEKGKSLRCIGVNVDPKAVDKIKAKGLEGICVRAEELSMKYQIRADLAMSFQMIEHLSDPVRFMHSIAVGNVTDYFLVTVPLVKESKVGLHHIRFNQKTKVTAEDVHLFELSPNDWKLLFQHAGWNPVLEDYYFQYPRHSLLSPLFKAVWRRGDYDGFYGVLLKRDLSWSSLYQDW